MKASDALKQENIPIAAQEHKGYNEDLRLHLIDYCQSTGDSLHKISIITRLSESTLGEYRSGKYKGDIARIEKILKEFFAKKEAQKITPQTIAICPTENAKKVYQCLEYCARRPNMALIIGPSGSGKTSALREWSRDRWWATYLCAGIVTKTCGAVIREVCQAFKVYTGQGISEAFDSLIYRIKGSKRMLIVDESHFFSWEALELLRQIHDSAGISVVLSGQERLYSQMRGTHKAFLYDQIFSRVGVKCYLKGLTPYDVGLVARSVCPTLDEDCIKFLFECCRREGRFRSVVKILEVALDACGKLNAKLSRKLLSEIYDEFFGED
jgi:hypothetical protein